MRKAITSGLLVSLALFLAACGGSSSPPSSSGPTVALTIEAYNNFLAAAYQVGSGPWKPLNVQGGYIKSGTFDLQGQTRYGVAVLCVGPWYSPLIYVIQATPAELPNPKVVCGGVGTGIVNYTVNLSIDPGLLAPGDGVWFTTSSSAGFVGAAASVSLSVPTTFGIRDLLLSLSDSAGVPKAIKVIKNLNVTGPGSTPATLAPTDALPTVSFTPPAAAGHTLLPGNGIIFVSSNGAQLSTNTSPTSYRPVSGQASGDHYLAWFRGSGGNSYLETLQAFDSGSPALAFPTPWTAGSLSVTQTVHPSIGGLSRSDPDLQYYRVYLELTGSLYYTALVSKGWLGTATSYTLPDLSSPSQLGYPSPTSGGGTLQVDAVLSNKPVLGQDTNPYIIPPAVLAGGDYIRTARAETNAFVIGGGGLSLP